MAKDDDGFDWKYWLRTAILLAILAELTGVLLR